LRISTFPYLSAPEIAPDQLSDVLRYCHIKIITGPDAKPEY
jgi:hypothetical protein